MRSTSRVTSSVRGFDAYETLKGEWIRMVFVLDKHKKPLMPCSEKRARLLLERGQAVIHRHAPFTIRLKDRTAEESRFQPLRVKFDPGSKTTGMSIILEGAQGFKVIFLGKSNTKRSSKPGWINGVSSVEDDAIERPGIEKPGF